MKLVEFELNGKIYYLLLTGAALFDSYDKFGDKGDLLDKVTGVDRASFDNTVWMLVKLAQQGEAYRRFMKLDPQPMLTPDEATKTMGPQDVIRARAAIRAAYAIGFGREEVNPEEEIDLYLAEYQKKTGLASREQSGLAERPNFWAFLFKKL